MKIKLGLLAIALAGVMAMAQTCTTLGATIVVINDDVWYSAEIRNDTNADILSHKMAVGFIKDQGLAVSKTVEPCLRSMQSGKSNFFSANSGLADNKVDTAVSRLVGPLTLGEVVNADITFSNIEATRDNEQLVVTGRIKNNDNHTLDNVRVCVVVRNSDGDVTRVDVVDLYVDGNDTDDDDQVTEPIDDLDNSVTNCEDINTPTNTSTATATATNTPATTPTATSTPELPDAC